MYAAGVCYYERHILRCSSDKPGAMKHLVLAAFAAVSAAQSGPPLQVRKLQHATYILTPTATALRDRPDATARALRRPCSVVFFSRHPVAAGVPCYSSIASASILDDSPSMHLQQPLSVSIPLTITCLRSS